MDLSNSNMGSERHGHFLNTKGDKENVKRQEYATLPFLKIDM